VKIKAADYVRPEIVIITAVVESNTCGSCEQGQGFSYLQEDIAEFNSQRKKNRFHLMRLIAEKNGKRKKRG